MIRLPRLALVLVALAGPVGSDLAQGEPAQGGSRLAKAAVTAHVEAALAADRVPGAVVGIVQDGRIVYLRGFGEDGHGRLVTPETGFRLGSMSKAFTAVAVMEQVEAGRLALNEPVRAVLPAFRLADMAAADAITLRDLLAHTSGIPAQAPRAGADAPLADHVAALSMTEPTEMPGEAHVYASPNYLVAALMVEAVTRRPFEDVLREDVLAPLGLTRTFVAAEEDREGSLARGHRYWFGFPVASDLAEERGRLATASLISSGGDMARFLLFQLGDGALDGQRLLSPEGMAAMHEGTAEGDGFLYAMGWRDGSVEGVRAVHHGGVLPDFRGRMVLLPTLGAGVVVLTNASGGLPLPAEATSHRLAWELAAALAGAPLAGPRLWFGAVQLAGAVALALILAGQVGGLVRVLRGGDAERRRRGRALLDLALVGIVAVSVPALTGLGWGQMATFMPDLALWAALMAALSVTTSMARLLGWPRRER